MKEIKQMKLERADNARISIRE